MTDELRSVAAWRVSPTRSLRYRVYCRAFALAVAIRLTLPDALRDEWLVPALITWAGAVVLAVNGAVLGFALCAVGLVAPLVFLSDQLTQSVYMLGCCCGAMACFAGSRAGREERMAVGFPFIVRVLTVGTYALAALHKLNRDFFVPAVSCANGGMRLLAADWDWPWLATLATSPALPHLFVAVEACLAVLFVVRPAAGLVLGLVMHIPLTIIFAPAFAFTMISGWVMLLGDADLRHLGETWRRRWKIIVPLGGIAAAASLSRYPRERWVSDPDWCVKEAVLWIGLAWAVTAWASKPAAPTFGFWSGWRDRPRGAPRVIGWFAAGVWGLNGLTPYTGLQFQHTAAMLSNLRIDQGCWNSVVFPETVRLVDPYVRIDSASLGPPPGKPRQEAEIVEILWNTESLHRARERWCRVFPRPISLGGTHQGASFEIRDFCAEDGWVFGSSLAPRFRRFQVNLLRECPQACVH